MTKGIFTDEAAKFLLQQCADRTYISTHISTNISKNTVFLVDTSNLLDVADVKCDDLGAWQCTGSPKFYYSTDQDGNFHKHEDPEHCPANQAGAPNVNFRKISVRKTISDLEFSEHLL